MMSIFSAWVAAPKTSTAAQHGLARLTRPDSIGRQRVEVHLGMTEDQMARVLARHRQETVKAIVTMNERDPTVLHT